jgi:L-serine dehydratase
MGFQTDDKRIKESIDIAQESGFKYTFKSSSNASALHPNSIRLQLLGGGREIEVLGESRGGGVVNIAEINGFKAGFSAAMHTLIIFAADVKGSIAFVADVLAHDDCNIATMSVSRKGKNDLACQVIEMDSGIKPVTFEYLKSLSWIEEVIYIPEI